MKELLLTGTAGEDSVYHMGMCYNDKINYGMTP